MANLYCVFCYFLIKLKFIIFNIMYVKVVIVQLYVYSFNIFVWWNSCYFIVIFLLFLPYTNGSTQLKLWILFLSQLRCTLLIHHFCHFWIFVVVFRFHSKAFCFGCDSLTSSFSFYKYLISFWICKAFNMKITISVIFKLNISFKNKCL